MAAHPYTVWNKLQVLLFKCNTIDTLTQTRVKVYWKSGMSKMFNDIRFASVYGDSIKYYIQNIVKGKYAVVWLAIPARQNKVEMFYGNTNAVSESTTDIFDFYCDASSLSQMTPLASNSGFFYTEGDVIKCNAGTQPCTIYKTMPFNLLGKRVAVSMLTRPVKNGALKLGFFANMPWGEISHYRYSDAQKAHSYMSNNTFLSGGKNWRGVIYWDELYIKPLLVDTYATSGQVKVTGHVTSNNSVVPENSIGLTSISSDSSQEIYFIRVQSQKELTNPVFANPVKNERTVTSASPAVPLPDISMSYDMPLGFRIPRFGTGDQNKLTLLELDMDTLPVRSFNAERGINDPYWTATIEVLGTVDPLSDTQVAVIEKDCYGKDQYIFVGVIPNRSDSIQRLGETTVLKAYSYEYLLTKQKINYTLSVVKLNEYYNTWRAWVISLLDETGLDVGFFDNGPVGDPFEIAVNPLMSKYEVIQKIAEHCQCIFYCEFTDGNPKAHFVNVNQIDHGKQGIGMPPAIAIDINDDSIVERINTEFLDTKQYNSVTVRGYDRVANEFVYGHVESPAVAANLAVRRDGFEHYIYCSNEADCKIRAQQLLTVFEEPILKVTLPLRARFDLQLYQQIKLLGEDLPVVLQQQDKLRITRIRRNLAFGDWSVGVEAVQDLGIDILQEFSGYFDDSIVQQTQSLVEDTIKKREEAMKNQ